MKKYRKNSKIVDAVQFDGSEETLNEIRELLEDKASAVDQVSPDFRRFSLIGHDKTTTIYNTDWIVRDEIDNDHTLFFVISDDIFHITHSEIKT